MDSHGVVFVVVDSVVMADSVIDSDSLVAVAAEQRFQVVSPPVAK